MSRHSKKRTSIGAVFAKTLLLVIAVGIVYLGYNYYTMSKENGDSSITETINKEITKKAVDEIVSEATDGEYTLSEIKENMSQDDQDTVDEIIDKYAEEGIVSEAIETLTDNSGDITKTIEELKDQIDSSDIEAIKELYEKYGTNQ